MIHFLKVDVVKDRIDILIDLWFGTRRSLTLFLQFTRLRYSRNLPLRSKFFDVSRLSVQQFWGLRLFMKVSTVKESRRPVNPEETTCGVMKVKVK